MNRTAVLSAAALSALLVTTLGACGTDVAKEYSKNSAKKIDADAEAAMKGLKSVHFKGNFTDDDGSAEALDMSMSSSGECVGSVTVKGESVQVVVTSKASYMKAGAAFWKAQTGEDAAGTLFGDKWITGFPSSLEDQLCPWSGLFDQIDDDDNAKDTVAGTSKVGDTPVVLIKGTDDDGKPITAQVAATKPHYVLAMKASGGQKATFTDFNKKVSATAPSGAVDLSSLGG